MLRRVGLLMAIIVAATAGFLLGQALRLPNRSEAFSTHTGPTIEQLQMLSTLVTLKVDVADVQETTIRGYVGGVRAVIVIKGDFLLSVDLSRARFQDMDAERRSVVVVLPPPQVISPRVDHSRSRIFAVSRDGLWLLVPTDRDRVAVINRAMADAQKFVMDAAVDPSLADRSRQQTEKVIETFFGAMAWNVSVRWSDQHRPRAE